MEIVKLLKQAELSGETDKNTIGMILSNRMDMATEQGGLISVKNFDVLANDLILWAAQSSKLRELRRAVDFLDKCKLDADSSSTGAFRDACDWLESAARCLLA